MLGVWHFSIAQAWRQKRTDARPFPRLGQIGASPLRRLLQARVAQELRQRHTQLTGGSDQRLFLLVVGHHLDFGRSLPDSEADAATLTPDGA